MTKGYSRATAAIAEVLGFLMAALLGFASALLLERLLTRYSDWYAYSVKCWPLMLCWLCGRLSAKSKSGALTKALGAVSVAAALAVICLTAGAGDLIEYVRLGLTAVPGLMLYYIGLVCVPVYPQSFAIGAVFLYLFEIVFFAFAFDYGGAATPLNVCAMGAFLLYLFSANVKSLYMGLHAAGEDRGLPSGIRWRNTLLLAGFTVGALAIAATGLFQVLIRLIIRLVAYIIALILSWLKGLEEPAINIAPPQSEMGDPGEMPEAGWLRTLIIVLILAAVAVAAVGLILAVLKFRRKGERKPRKKRRRRRYTEDEARDEEESVFDWAAFLNRGRESLRNLAERFRRKPRFDDMPDDVSKMRFAYRKLLISPASGERAVSSTPLEMSGALDGPKSRRASRLASDYSRVRYGEKAPEKPDVENARQALKEIGRLEKTKS